MENIEKKPCPHCGSSEHLVFKAHVSYGHGDCGFEGARIACINEQCEEGYNYGQPTEADRLAAWEKWNKRIEI